MEVSVGGEFSNDSSYGYHSSIVEMKAGTINSKHKNYRTVMETMLIKQGWNLNLIPQFLKKKVIESQDESSSVVIASNVSLKNFKKLDTEQRLGCKFALQDGNVMIYELPHITHGIAQNRISNILTNWCDDEANGSCRVITDWDVYVGSNSREPDVSLQPRGLPNPPTSLKANDRGGAFPTLVVEIGVAQSLSDLHNLASLYFSSRTTIRIYLALKIYPRRRDGTVAMVALLYLRSHSPNIQPVRVISFGTAPLHPHARDVILSSEGIHCELGRLVGFVNPDSQRCDRKDLEVYRVVLTKEEVYHGVSLMPTDVPDLVLDLFLYQQSILPDCE